MSRLYLTSCMPRITIKKGDPNIQVEYVWVNEEVKKLYSELQQHLANMKKYDELSENTAITMRPPPWDFGE